MWLINYHPIPFLNCLCGSEQVNKTAVNRFDRIHPFYFLFYQSFIFFYSYQSLWAFPDFYHQIGCKLLSSTQKNSLKSPGRAPKAPRGNPGSFSMKFSAGWQGSDHREGRQSCFPWMCAGRIWRPLFRAPRFSVYRVILAAAVSHLV